MSKADDLVHDLAAPLVTAAGLDLLDVKVARAGKHTRVRIIVDTKGGIDIESCQAVGREISAAMDQVDPINSTYTLEVTSPGLDWPLKTRRDFDRVEGRQVTISLLSPPVRSEPALNDDVDAPLEVTGEVVAANPEVVVIRDHDETRHHIGYDSIDAATQDIMF